jgi:protein SCO1/2
MLSKRLFRILPAAAAVAVAATSCRATPPHGVVIDAPRPAAPLVVSMLTGRPYELAADTGKFVLLYFGYTHCPDYCPMMLTDWARVSRDLGAKAKGIRFVFVSVDPDRDTPQLTERFVHDFDPSFIGLAPTVTELETIKRAWEITTYKEESASPGRSPERYSVAHPANAFLLDRSGRVRVLYPPETRWQDLAADLRRML